MHTHQHIHIYTQAHDVDFVMSRDTNFVECLAVRFASNLLKIFKKFSLHLNIQSVIVYSTVLLTHAIIEFNQCISLKT